MQNVAPAYYQTATLIKPVYSKKNGHPKKGANYSYFGARYYDSDLSVWLSVDPLSDKYPGLSPYSYCANNPVILVDPDGREIWITSEDGTSFMYLKGMKYDGTDEIVAKQINSLNQMYSTKNGSVVLDRLSNSIKEYNLTNEKSKGGAGFIENENGGKFNMNGNNDVMNISHEMFHAFQYDNGQGGASSFNEIEAYAFSQGVFTEYAMNTGLVTMWGNCSASISKNPATENGNKYENAFNSVLYSNEFPAEDFNTAVSLFKSESNANASGDYDNYPLRRPNQKISLLQNLYPIIK
jgi:RHS repeat-associated protein